METNDKKDENIIITYVKYNEDEVPNKLTTCLCDELPKNETGLFFGAFGFIFDDQKRLLLTNLKKRGWDIPGGKTEEKDRNNSNIMEMLLETLKRETLEETSVKIKEMKLIGYRKTERDPKNISNKFPHSVTYMVYFFGKIDEMLDFEKESQENGAIGRGVFTKEEAEKIETVFLKHTELFRKAYSLLLE